MCGVSLSPLAGNAISPTDVHLSPTESESVRLRHIVSTRWFYIDTQRVHNITIGNEIYYMRHAVSTTSVYVSNKHRHCTGTVMV